MTSFSRLAERTLEHGDCLLARHRIRLAGLDGPRRVTGERQPNHTVRDIASRDVTRRRRLR
jgi:hypothetical protein